MTEKEAGMLVARLREAFPAWGWNDLRFAIYAEALRPFPYSPSLAVVQDLERSWETTQAPAVGLICKRIESRLGRQKALEDQRAERRQLAAPRDPEIKALLKRTVAKLSMRSGGAPVTRETPRERATIDDPAALRGRATAKRRLREQAARLRRA